MGKQHNWEGEFDIKIPCNFHVWDEEMMNGNNKLQRNHAKNLAVNTKVTEVSKAYLSVLALFGQLKDHRVSYVFCRPCYLLAMAS